MISSNQTPTNPLAAFNRLSSSVYLRQPTQPAPSKVSRDPKTIILLGWLQASPRNIGKYILGYSKLYPTARIILITSVWQDMIYRGQASQRKLLAPAIDAIQSDQDPNSLILLHLFSNGGAKSACNLSSLFHETTQRPLPVAAMVLDSAPGRGTVGRSATALLAGAPKKWYIRVPLTALIYCILSFLWCLAQLGLPRNIITRLREDLNNQELFPDEAPRCYIYSEADEMVWWKAVEDHAREAEKRGWKVRMEKFAESGHAAHIRVDENRYWGTIRTLWENSEE